MIPELFIDNNLNKNTPLDVISEEGRIHCNTMLENMLNKYGFKHSITNTYHSTKSKVKQWKCYKTQKRKPVVGEKSIGSRPKLCLKNLKWFRAVSLTTLTKVISLKKNIGHGFKDVNERMKHYDVQIMQMYLIVYQVIK